MVALARSAGRGRARLPEAGWVGADLRQLTEPHLWRPRLAGVDAVVNAAGVLQNGLRDDVVLIQRDAIVALVTACEAEGVDVFIQISAPGATAESPTRFYRSKAAADEALRQSRLRWTIFRPGLVLAPQAYGGTSLLRMLAAVPVVQPLVMADARIQTVSVDDVADAVAAAVSGAHAGRDFDLVEAESHSLESVVLRMRAWLGFGPPRAVIRLPDFAGRALARGADLAGWLGWRSAMRTTSLTVLRDGVRGEGRGWAAASGKRLRPLEETLRALPSTVQERVYARGRMVLPLLLLALAGFWLISGLVGLVRLDAAAALLMERMSAPAARAAVAGSALADIVIGMALLVRPLARPACLAAIAVSVAYLIAGALLAPGMWVDPAGPMIKVFPAMALALAVAALLEER